MNTENRSISCRAFSLVEILITIVMVALFAALAIVKAHAQFNPNYFKTDTNSPVTVTNGQSKIFGGYKYPLRQGVGISEFVQVVSTNATATSATIGHDLTWNGTNGTTTHPIQFTVPGNFVGTNIYWTNYPASYVSNVRTIGAATVTNNSTGTIPGSNSLAITVTWSQDNQ